MVGMGGNFLVGLNFSFIIVGDGAFLDVLANVGLLCCETLVTESVDSITLQFSIS